MPHSDREHVPDSICEPNFDLLSVILHSLLWLSRNDPSTGRKVLPIDLSISGADAFFFVANGISADCCPFSGNHTVLCEIESFRNQKSKSSTWQAKSGEALQKMVAASQDNRRTWNYE
jgi:hypothetical protein